MSSPAYREVQRVVQVWIWAVVLAVSALAWYWQVVSLSGGAGSAALPPAVMVVLWALLGVGLPVFTAAARMVVEVDRDGVLVRWLPLLRRRIPFSEIAAHEPTRYRPLRDFLGWGVRWTPHGGTAYTMSGCLGVQLRLRSGKRVLIGSRDPEALDRAIGAGLGDSPQSGTRHST